MKALKRILPAVLAFALAAAVFAGSCAAQAAFGGPPPEGGVAGAQMPAEFIFRQSADAVFLLETFDKSGDSIRTGSGFFISEDGLGVTNLHVINDAASATITLYNGDTYPVRGVCATSQEFNLCVISIDSDGGKWDFLPLADSDYVEAGNTVYAIGSPLGYINTMTAGIISNTRREVEGETLIQFTAPISFGSGGSPLLNTAGEVVGVTSSSFSYGQNLNLAVPVNHVKAMQIGSSVPLSKLLG